MGLDALELSKELMACPSITPIDAGAMAMLVSHLEPLGFECDVQVFTEEGSEPTSNLYARYGTTGRNLCFAGHVDVVPPGDLSAWRIDPFDPQVIDGVLYGRGAVDMKAAVTCFVAAVSRVLENNTIDGSISFLITGDEEGPATNGTKKMLAYLADKGEKIDACIVGEPTNPETLGDMIKVGRRGSIGFELTVKGVQGHVAYPHLAENPIPTLAAIVDEISRYTLDEGTEYFPTSNLEVTNIHVGNSVGNVIPAEASSTFNIRFNTEHTGESLHKWVETVCQKYASNYELNSRQSAECFLTPEGELSQVATEAVREITGKTPELSTTGGTSDARFIKDYCPVVEFGLINQTAHKVDECIGVDDIYALERIYEQMILRYFG